MFLRFVEVRLDSSGSVFCGIICRVVLLVYFLRKWSIIVEEVKDLVRLCKVIICYIFVFGMVCVFMLFLIEMYKWILRF